MENKSFMTVDEVAQELNVSKYRKSEYQLLPQEVMLQRIERR